MKQSLFEIGWKAANSEAELMLKRVHTLNDHNAPTDKTEGRHSGLIVRDFKVLNPGYDILLVHLDITTLSQETAFIHRMTFKTETGLWVKAKQTLEAEIGKPVFAGRAISVKQMLRGSLRQIEVMADSQPLTALYRPLLTPRRWKQRSLNALP